VEVLEKIPLFSGLSMHQFKKILAICSKRNLPQSEVLCRMGEESFEIFILLKGELAVTFEDGKEFSHITPIGVVGEMGVFTGDRRSANIVAVADSLLLSIHKTEIMRVLRAEADMSVRVLINVIDVLSEKIKYDNRIIEDLRQVCPPGQWTQIIKNAENRMG
jgi:CRP-like cAMP-binding protein